MLRLIGRNGARLVLTKVVDQDALIKYIDEQIDGALDTLREIVKTNEATS